MLTLMGLWKRFFHTRYYCHVYRIEPNICEIRSGIRYGRGDLLASSSEPRIGEAVPELLKNEAVGRRELVATPDTHAIPLIGQWIPGADEFWHPFMPKPGEIWVVGKDAIANGFPSELIPRGLYGKPFEIRVLERVRGYWGSPSLRIMVIETGKVWESSLSIRHFTTYIRPKP